MLWRIRTHLVDRPGALAELAARCGADDINILSLEVFTTEIGAVDELVVSAAAGWTAERLEGLVSEAGCSGTTVRPCQADVLSDGPTRYLRSVLRLLEDPSGVDEELEKLQGLNEYTAAEWARADVLVEIAGRVAEMLDRTVTGPRPGDGLPVLRPGTVDDAAAIVDLHDRCSQATRAQRYHVPMPRLTARTARHLCAPPDGASVVACVGDAIVGMATIAPWDELGGADLSVMEVAVLVEDGWQGRGIGTALLSQIVAAARVAGADRVVCVVQPGNVAMLRTVSAARLRARIISSGGYLTVSVALTDRGAAGAGDAADRLPVPYGLTRGADSDSRGASARTAGEPAGEHAFAGAAAVPPDPAGTGPAGAGGADRDGGPARLP
ncbi:MAG TPA: GNAT family N-acetyltransferase [Kribbellaceae bacterium]|nr:GNAT family N-acetyltransferase [Kribbellaceae bacterium]